MSRIHKGSSACDQILIMPEEVPHRHLHEDWNELIAWFVKRWLKNHDARERLGINRAWPWANHSTDGPRWMHPTNMNLYSQIGRTFCREIFWLLEAAREINYYGDRMALKFDGHLGNAAVELPAIFPSEWKSLKPAEARVFETLRDLAVRPRSVGEWRPWDKKNAWKHLIRPEVMTKQDVPEHDNKLHWFPYGIYLPTTI